MEMKENYNVVVLGDSISKGVVFDSEKSKYTTLKECFVSLVGSSIRGTVYNAGRFGSTVIRGVSKMYNDVMKKTPDIVLIEFGGNDCDFNWDDVASSPNVVHEPNTDIETFKNTLVCMIDTLNKANVIPVLMTLPPLDPKRYFNWITKKDPRYQENILKWLGTENTIFTWHNLYSDMITDVADTTKTPLIDVRTEFLKYSDYNRFLCIDGIHPNSEGHSLIANTVLGFIREKYDFLLQK